MTEWRSIPGWDAYEATMDGRIRRAPGHGRTGGQTLSLAPDSLGYLRCTLSQDGRRQCYLVNRLVCETFNGAPPTPKHDAAHIDGKPGNNHATNLRWSTRVENMADAKRHGTWCHGSKQYRAKLSDDLVAEIGRAVAAGEMQKDIAARLGVSSAAVSMAKNRRTWRHVP